MVGAVRLGAWAGAKTGTIGDWKYRPGPFPGYFPVTGINRVIWQRQIPG
jgi:hypothetical protein